MINCALVKGMRYNRATETFHQWRDTRQVYGLNFANVSDAVSFGDSVQEALEGDNKRTCSELSVCKFVVEFHWIRFCFLTNPWCILLNYHN